MPLTKVIRRIAVVGTGVEEAAHPPVDELAKEKNEVLLGLLALRDKVGIDGSRHVDWSRAA